MVMEYRFKPITKVCAATGQPLVPGEECYSVLIERMGQQERLDFSEAGWTGLPENAVGFWKCRVPEPEAKQAATADPERLLQFFEQLIESPNHREERLAYVLALFLLQRRRLRLDGSKTEEGTEFLLLSGSRGEGPYEVKDQQLSESEMAELRGVLNQEITRGWNAAA